MTKAAVQNGGLFAAQARREAYHPKMRIWTCLLFAFLVGLSGAALRMAIPVTPVDAPFRDVIHFYRSLELPGR